MLFPTHENKYKPLRCNNSMGIAACAFVHFSKDFWDNKDHKEFKLLCQSTYTRCDKDYFRLFSRVAGFPISKASFKFECVDEDYQEFEGVKVKECGIHILYSEDDDGRLIFDDQNYWKFEEEIEEEEVDEDSWNYKFEEEKKREEEDGFWSFEEEEEEDDFWSFEEEEEEEEEEDDFWSFEEEEGEEEEEEEEDDFWSFEEEEEEEEEEVISKQKILPFL